jgi:putative flippase GtrA
VVSWLRFNVVGAGGAIMQVTLLWALEHAGVQYLLATALAVEAALLHNFHWHVRWTWRDREPSLLRFHVANGAVSIVSNLVWMRVFTGAFGMPVIPANGLAIAITSLANFALGERWVFAVPAQSHPE